MSNSVQPQRRQPTRLPHPWDSPGKNTGVGCHFLLHTCTAFQLLSRIKLNVLNTVCKIRSPPMWLSSWSVTCQHKHLKCHLTIFFFFFCTEGSRRDGRNTWKNRTKKILMNWITMMVWSVSQSQTFWSTKSSGP